jgi:Fic family protein
LIGEKLPGSAAGLRLLDFLFQSPIITVRMAESHLGCAYVTAANLIQEMEKAGILRETTGQQRNRRYRYEPYLNLFERL